MIKTSQSVKVSLLVCSVLLITFIAAVNLWLDPYVKSNLPAWAAKASKYKYELTLNDISIHLWSKSITLKNISLKSHQTGDNDTQEHKTSLFFEAAQLELDGISIWGLLTGNKVHCNRLTILRPYIRIATDGETKSTDSLKKETKALREFSVGFIDIEQLYLIHIQKGRAAMGLACKGNIKVYDWLLSAEGQRRHHIADYIQSSYIEANDLTYYKTGSYYRYSLGRIELNKEEHTCTFSDLNIKPTYGRKAFYKRLGHRQTIYNVHLRIARMEQLDWQNLADSNQLIAEKLLLDSADIHLFFSRQEPLPPKDKMGTYPAQMLMKLPFPLSFKQIEVKNMDVEYRELSSFTKHEGGVKFTAIYGTINEVTNMSLYINNNPHCVAKLQGMLGKSPVHMNFDFLLTTRDGSFTNHSTIRNVSHKQVNPLLVALGGVKLNSFNMRNMEVHITGNENSMRGYLTMLYDSLKLDLTPHNDKRIPLISTIADKMIYPANAMQGERVRHVQMKLDRDPDKPFFNQLWQTIFTGMQKTVLHNEKLPDMVNKNKKTFRNWLRKK
ncbi:MAG: hypothetical protein V4620_05055 [Bacteroidota bacterium]